MPRSCQYLDEMSSESARRYFRKFVRVSRSHMGVAARLMGSAGTTGHCRGRTIVPPHQRQTPPSKLIDCSPAEAQQMVVQGREAFSVGRDFSSGFCITSATLGAIY